MSAYRRYKLTRRTKTTVWLRWEAYGPMGRGLSRKMTVDEFKSHYKLAPKKDGLDVDLYFRTYDP